MEKVTQVHQAQPTGFIPTMPTIPKFKKNKTPKLLVIGALVVIAGIGTGWVLSGGVSAQKGDSTYSGNAPKQVKNDKEMGVSNESFKDSAEGKLVKGGIDGEGTYHLERPGGASQNVYLSSTVIDLGSFEGKNVQVWGQTLAGKKAGWLMDVGKIKVTE